MAKYKIEYSREDCIGAAACAAVAPQFWEIVSDGKADLLNSKFNEQTKMFELEIETEEDITAATESADVCPVNVIKVTKIKD